jgi:hypothetical protein
VGWLKEHRRWGKWAVALLALAWFVKVSIDQLRLVGDWRVDDAYISFGYAKNLIEGRGLTYAGGELRVEGYSNFLWVLISALVQSFAPKGALAGARLITMVLGLLLAVFTFLLARRRSGVLAAALALLVMATMTDFARAAQSGLETVPYTALLMFAFFAYLREAPERRRWSLLAFVPVALMRIDGVMPLAFVIGFELASQIADKRFDWRMLLRWAGPALAIVGLYWLWRWRYYGMWLPTTYYAKNMVTNDDQYRGASYVIEGLRDLGLLWPMLLAAFGVGRRPSREGVCLLAFTLLSLISAARVGGDWMPFNRFLLPVVPFMLVLFAWGASELWRAARELHLVAALASLVVTLGVASNTAEAANALTVESPREEWKIKEAKAIEGHTRGLLATSPFITAIVRSEADTLVTDYGGIFPFFTKVNVIEMWGLCNKEIALRGTTRGVAAVFGKTCVECYADWQPDYFHVITPLLRRPNSLTNIDQVIDNVFQGRALNRVLDFRRNYAVGRVVRRGSRDALFFLERRRPDRPLEKRTVGDLVVDYPFEPKRGRAEVAGPP